MKKTVLFVLVAIFLALAVAGCGAKEAATGPALVTVTGKIDKDSVVLDEAAFTKNAKELATFDPWVGDAGKDVTEKGILLTDLIKLVKPDSDAKTVSIIATDGKGFDISMEDAQKYNVMLSHWIDGTVLEEKTGGPVKLAIGKDWADYPAENWAWWVVKVEFK